MQFMGKSPIARDNEELGGHDEAAAWRVDIPPRLVRMRKRP
jgi:hypothetical protein